jgi:hypothetical protein
MIIDLSDNFMGAKGLVQSSTFKVQGFRIPFLRVQEICRLTGCSVSILEPDRMG